MAQTNFAEGACLVVSACAGPAAPAGDMAGSDGDEMMESSHFRATIPFFAQD